MIEKEGLTKFSLRYEQSSPLPDEAVRELCAWRRIFFQTGLIAQSPDRYQGYGFGNISCRLTHFSEKIPEQALFAISGTQTGQLAELDARHFAIVVGCDVAQNHISAIGPIRPSSESMTHAAIYCENESTGAVIHGHSPDIWNAAEALKIPTTSPNIAYGTPEMAYAVQEQVAKISQSQKPTLLAMGGHEDGIVAFGRNLETAGTVLIKYLVKAYALSKDVLIA